MPTSFPSQIKLGNRTVSVSFAPDLQSAEGAPIMGFYNPAEPAIVIKSGMSPMDTVETFWHELMHAIFDFTRFGVEMTMEMDDKDTPEQDAFKVEERVAESFAKVFLQVIQDNPTITDITQ